MCENKTVIITGTARDIGLGLKNKFLSENYNVLELNHVDYDFTNLDIIKELYLKLEQINNNNIVGCINNSYALGIGQLEFLFMIARLFGNDNTKFIVSLGSINADRYEFSNIDQVKYSTYKYALRQAHKNLKELYPDLKLIYRELSMCDTSYNVNKSNPKMSIIDISNNIFKSI